MTIEIDGSQGEGGGQVLRSALTLSMCTGQAVRIKNIRARRKSPGLMRQHLTAVNAATEICQANTQGAQLNSTQLSFSPGAVRGGNYRFSIGTAGSCTLVLQTILPALLLAQEDSRVTLSGGTHNSMSPPFHFLERAFLPLLSRMGAQIEMQLNRFGFYPAGGGEITVNIKGGCKFSPLHLPERGKRLNAYAESFFAALPAHIAERELAIVGKQLTWSEDQLFIREIKRDNCHGPGNALLITLENEHVTEVFTGFGEKGVTAETVAKKTAHEAKNYLASSAAVGEHLADQLLLPIALAGGGSFTATEWSNHAETNVKVIKAFLPIKVQVEKVQKCLVNIAISTRALES